jgi:hypothetical protein
MHPLPGQLLAAVGEHPQRFQPLAVREHPQPLGADRDDHDRARVVGVGLAVFPRICLSPDEGD